MVENTPPVVAQRDNLIEVSRWNGRDENDKELVELLDFLKKQHKSGSKVTDYSKGWKELRGHNSRMSEKSRK